MKKIVLSVIGVALLFYGCSSLRTDNPLSSTEQLAVYKKAVNNQWDLPTDKDVRTVDRPRNDIEKVAVLIKLMKEESDDGRTVALMPEDVTILETVIDGKVMTVNLSSEINRIPDDKDRTLLFETIERTLILNFSTKMDVFYIPVDGEKVKEVGLSTGG